LTSIGKGVIIEEQEEKESFPSYKMRFSSLLPLLLSMFITFSFLVQFK
jgi:hypothetical protein